MDSNTLNAILAICGAVVTVATVIGNVFTYRKTQQVHELVNSNQAEFRRLVGEAAHAAGVLEGKGSSGEKKI